MNESLTTLALWGMRISSAAALLFSVGMTGYAWLSRNPQTPQLPRKFDDHRRRPTSQRTSSVAVYGIVGLFMMWLWAEVRGARKVSPERMAEITTTAENALEAEYIAAQSITSDPTPTHQIRGYVYLGRCDKQWVTRQFGALPPCTESLPENGHKIMSWKGDVVRASLPTTVNGQRQFGKEVARVNFGHSVILRKLIPVSFFQSGPQYYWGLVDVPEESLLKF